MGKTLIEIEKDVKNLTISEKELLVDELLLEIDPTPRAEVDRLRHELIKQRYADVAEGRVQGVDGEAVVAKIRKSLNEKN
ncbi:MAG: addiction module protein [Spirochaetia bacterium]|nr:addiction module protein [Spirochaetia bacterium]